MLPRGVGEAVEAGRVEKGVGRRKGAEGETGLPAEEGEHEREPYAGAEARPAVGGEREIGVEPERLGRERGADACDKFTHLRFGKAVEEEQGRDGVVGGDGKRGGERVGVT